MNDRHACVESAGYANSMRQSGLDVVGAVPWGTHFSQFYATGQDLVETLVPYFQQGLLANEFCMWITAAPLCVEQAKAALAAVVPDLDQRLARRQIEIIDYSEWYTKSGTFDAATVLQGWADKLADACQRGFEGLRLTGNTFWLEDAGWQGFKHYEDTVHRVIGASRVLALCSYSLEKCGLREILDVMANHEFALVKQDGRWELIRAVEHQAELALRENRERMERFAEITFEGIVISENGKVFDCNEQLAGLLGYSVPELKGMPIMDLVVPEDRERIVENIRLGRESHVEHGMIRKDGSRLFVEARGKNSPTHPHQRYTAVRDITARKLMEAAGEKARRALEWERNVLQAVMDGAGNTHLVFLDRNFNFVRVNQAYARTCGYTPDEMVGKSHFALYPHAENEAIFTQVRDTGVAVEYHDKPFVFPDQPDRGVTYWDWTLIPVRDASGLVDGLVFSLLETTERKRAELALSESEERFRAMVQAVPSLTFEGDAGGLCTFVSDSWCAYTGMSVEQSRGWGWAQAVHPEDRADAVAKWTDAAQSGRACEITYRLRAADGSYRWFMDRAVPARDPAGLVERWAGSVTDIHDLVQAQHSLEEADRHKDEFLAMLAHELRNPLAPIRNAVHVMGRPGLDQPRIQWAKEIIDSQVSHLTHMVDDLLDVSRIARGKIVLKKETVDLAELARRTLDAVRPMMEAKSHALHVDLPGVSVKLDADPVRLSQVLHNLLDNAAKYTPEGGTIVFSARDRGQQVEIEVRDNGVGISPSLLPRVFDLFQQGDISLDRANGGLGIGLTLVRRLVEKHGGSVEARSDGSGRGASFTVRLPILASSAPCRTVDALVSHRSVAGLRVLVVDDQAAVADSTAVLLEMEGHDVRIAPTGFVALELVQAFRPHAVLLDMGLPGMDGFETARRLRQMPEGRDVCLMAVTGYGDEETRLAAAEAGCDHHLVKPSHVDKMIRLLTDVSCGQSSQR